MTAPSPRPDRPTINQPATIAVGIVAFAGGLLLGNLPQLANWGPPVVAVVIIHFVMTGTLARRSGRARCPSCGLAADKSPYAPRPDPWSGPPEIDDGEILSPTHADLVKNKRLRSPGSPNGPGLMP